MYTVTVYRAEVAQYRKRFDSMMDAVNYAIKIEYIFNDLKAKVRCKL